MSLSRSHRESASARASRSGWFGSAIRASVVLLIVGLITLGASSSASADDAVATDLGIRGIDLIEDSDRSVVYILVPPNDVNYPNSVVRMDLDTLEVLGTLPLGHEPTAMAMSDDNQYLYVGLLEQSQILRIELSTFLPDLEIEIPVGPQVYWAHDIAVLPGQPETIAASLGSGRSPNGLAVFDGAVMRPDRTAEVPDSEEWLIFGPDGTLYASSDGFSFFVVDIGPDGPIRTFIDTEDEMGDGNLGAVIGGRVFTSNGTVLDVSGLEPVVSAQYELSPYLSDAMHYSEETGDLYFASSSRQNIAPFVDMVISQYNPETDEPIRSVNVHGDHFNRPSSLLPLSDTSFLVTTRYDNILWHVTQIGVISGTVTDHHRGNPLATICVLVSPFGQPDIVVANQESLWDGTFSVQVPLGTYEIWFVDCDRWDYAIGAFGGIHSPEPVVATGAAVDLIATLTTSDMLGLVDTSQGLWALSVPRTDWAVSFYFGNPGDYPIMGDWDCDGIDTPGMYRQSDGYVYLRNSNTQGIADTRFFFGNPGDIPLAGDFNGDGCDTVSIFRPSESRVFVINTLGANDGGLGAAEFDYIFGNPGDKPFVGDFDFDGVDTIGLHRESTGLVYYLNSHKQGNADNQFVFGDPGDRLVAGNFSGFWFETPALFRPSNQTFYIRHSNTQGNADRTEVWGFAGPTWHPVAGVYGLARDDVLSSLGLQSPNDLTLSGPTAGGLTRTGDLTR